MQLSSRRFFGLSNLEGIFFAIMVATAESFALFYFTKEGLTTIEIALSSSLPLIFAAFVQLILPRVVSDKLLKPMLFLMLLLQLFGLLVFLYCSFYTHSFLTLLVGLILYWTGGLAAGPLWMDWISGHVEKKKFGLFFSKRSAITTTATLVCYIGTSFLTTIPHFFQIMFLVGLIARVLSLVIQTWLMQGSTAHEPQIEIKEEEASERTQHLPLEEESADPLKILIWFFIWSALFRMAVNISSPYFLPFMIHDLKLSTTAFVLLTAVPMLARTLYLTSWGRASEGKGAYWSIQLNCIFIALIPTLWTFGDNYLYLLALQFVTGIFWGGLELSSTIVVQNFAYNKARTYLGLQQALATIFSLFGALLGAYLYEVFKSYHFIFNVSSLARLIIAILFIFQMSKFKNFKMKPRASIKYITSVLTLRISFTNTWKTLLSYKK